MLTQRQLVVNINDVLNQNVIRVKTMINFKLQI